MGANHCWWAAAYDRVTVALERAVLADHRDQLLAPLEGAVLDVGAGTGTNFQHLRSATRVIAVEPDPRMRRQAEVRLDSAACPVEVLDANAESLPLPDRSVDAVVFTCVLCTVVDPTQALTEAVRVLKPGGRLCVLEHVRGIGELARWQDRITPIWRVAMGGCHLNRETHRAISVAGFRIEGAELFDPFPRWVPARPWLQLIATRT